MAAAPQDPRAFEAVSEIFGLASSLPYQLSVNSLERLMEVLAEHPIRPGWQVRALQAAALRGDTQPRRVVFSRGQQAPLPLLLQQEVASPFAPPGWEYLYARHLEQILDETRPDDYYIRHPFAAFSDPHVQELLLRLGIAPPVVSGYDLPFLKAVSDPVTEEPIQAQILVELARWYEGLGWIEEARLACEGYLKQYFPRYRSFEVLERLARLTGRNYVDLLLHRMDENESEGE